MPTGLYQALQSANTIEKESNYSSATWKIFSNARDAAQQMLDSLYVQEGDRAGEPSEANKYSEEKALEVDSLAVNLTIAQAGIVLCLQ